MTGKELRLGPGASFAVKDFVVDACQEISLTTFEGFSLTRKRSVTFLILSHICMQLYHRYTTI